jgi:multicopper oxidase
MRTPLLSQSRSGVPVSIRVAVRKVYSLASTSSPRPSLRPNRSQPVRASSPAVAAAERSRRRPGARVHQLTLSAAAAGLDLAGRQVTAWAYNHTVPGPLLRVRAGEVLRVQLDNRLPEATSIHWHGIRLRNDMDGVPDMTQPPVQPGSRFTYEFTLPDPGTYFFHPPCRPAAGPRPVRAAAG